MKTLKIFLLIVWLPQWVNAQDAIEGTWYNAEKTSKILVSQGKDKKFYGKIIWLKEPNKNGQPRTDEFNPNDKKKKEPLLGLYVLKGLKKDGKNYDDGLIYDPKNGKTYDCQAKLNGNKLDLRGYIGISLVGRTSTWTRTD